MDVYLKIESITNYNPVNPQPKPMQVYRRDCLRGMGHEDGNIPLSEVAARSLTALVYREYLDSAYTIPKPDKLVLADINEPVYYGRVPGTVIYAHPGSRLHIHVLNGAAEPHSFHVHGLRYGIAGDGAWPLGVQSSDGRRSDEICPGQTWTYTYDITDDMVGAWPFHDHYKTIGDFVNRGLFGGIVVLPRGHHTPPKMALAPELEEYLKLKEKRGTPPPAQQITALAEHLKEWAEFPHVRHDPTVHHPMLHVPLFFHFMAGLSGQPAFDKNPFNPGDPPFVVKFGAPGTFNFHCNFHAVMTGTVTVAVGGADTATFNLVGPPMKFVNPANNSNTATVRPGGTVQWVHASMETHSVTEDGAGIPSFCLNGRSFVGNTPTIEAVTGQKIRWYVFDLDLGTIWHNFHPHAQRWQFGGETIDVRSLSPAESFVAETTAPPVLLLPHEIGEKQPPESRPKDAKPYHLRADFLVHCHVEMHMMQGLAGLVRSYQTVWLTDAQADTLRKATGLPLDPGGNDCAPIDLERCHTLDSGKWTEVPDETPPKLHSTLMHSTLVPTTDKVLFWGYYYQETQLWDSVAGLYSDPAKQPADAKVPRDTVFSNLHSAGHAYLDTDEGTLLAHGGESSPAGPAVNRQSFLFHGATNQWEITDPTEDGRFYATSLTLADGKILTLFGTPLSTGHGYRIEVYDPVTNKWQKPPIDIPAAFDYLYYPWTYLLPGGDLFSAGNADHVVAGAPPGAGPSVSRRYSWTAPVDDPAKRWLSKKGNRSIGAQSGTSVLLPLRPPTYAPRVLMVGGNTPDAQGTAEVIDLSATTPDWTVVPKDLNVSRPEQVNSVLLPDGRVFLAGGVPGTNVGTVGPSEILDPENLAAGWTLGPTLKYARGYHSSAILLRDGSVLMGGGEPEGVPAVRPLERYFPGYCFLPRPTIVSVMPASVGYHAPFTVNTPEAPSIAEVVLMRPGAVTHGFNQSQRYVGCTFTKAAGALTVTSPPDGTYAPPGWYLLFLVDGGRVPSVGHWIRLH
jgi:plastocyanin